MTNPNETTGPSPALQSLLGDVGTELGWSLIQRFSTLVRESGSDAERTAALYIVDRLEELGIRHEVFEPDLYLSVPRDGAVRVGPSRFRAKPPAFSASTGPGGLSGSPVYVPSPALRDAADLFKNTGPPGSDFAGKIVVTEGYPMPVPVANYEAAGAVGQIYINPGRNVHWGICTTIWGTPGEGQLDNKPRTPVVAINQEDGLALLAALRGGATDVRIETELDEGWFPCLLPVAYIDGASEDFLLVHGHYDSWDVGIGDNAVGDATLLELARIFDGHRTALERSLRVAWWPGHSTGRYGGSTWYADEFGLDLKKRCVAAVNIDSPGCWGATVYEELPWMAEAGALCRSSVTAVAGTNVSGQRPPRAGDYSFNQVGLSSFFMLLSNIPKDEREELGFYPVGGCGGNIAWHTEDDLIDVADRDNLERDLRLYVTAIGRFLTDAVLPLDFRETVDELDAALDDYESVGAGAIDLQPIREELQALRDALRRFYSDSPEDSDSGTRNQVLMDLSRILVPLGYAKGEAFDHDPATPRVPIPKLGRVHELARMRAEAPERVPFLITELGRQCNKVAGALWEATRLVNQAAG